MRARPNWRPLAALLAIVPTATLALGLTVAVAPSALAADEPGLAAQFVADINAARASAGLPGYSVAGDLTAIAEQHSAAMAASQTLYHNPDLTTEVQNWQSVGENVGFGPSVSDINTAFLNSPEHRANILDAHYTQVGVGVYVDSRGALWVTEDFRQPMSVAAPPPPVSQPAAPAPPPATTHPSTPSPAAPVTEAAAHPAAARPAPPRPTPAQLLARRMNWIKAHTRAPAKADPVAQALTYLNNVAALAGSPVVG
jgi:hypothetical protein